MDGGENVEPAIGIDLETIFGLSIDTNVERRRMDIGEHSFTRLKVQDVCDNQTSMIVEVYQGERLKCKYNFYLGELEVFEILLAPKGVSEGDISSEMDTYGSLTITSKIKSNGKTGSCSIFVGEGGLPNEVIEKNVEYKKRERARIVMEN
ncbi:hypothetical protein OSB04_018450 [Centaurea solstitialis]|uniref:Uncharacterized protein n=1 Tax=Centaurea solstitialis TaxID=347529 RepID=A0AA38WJC3_9ASTR|nr:hypothetical protein OSB04_018450 [Centaurea solstitialis]